MAGLNKKILCFIDEYGTAGETNFALGLVMVWARECGRVDKALSDLLPSSVNEVHATNWKNTSLHSLLARLSRTDVPGSLLMLNKRADVPVDTKPVVYASTLIETVKIGIRRFAKVQGIVNSVGNVEVITDANDQNGHPDFADAIENARLKDGRFKAVTRVVPLDSAASRVLQLADVVAHSRAWVDNAEVNAKRLGDVYNIETL